MKQESKQDIVLRLTEGLNAQQRSVPQLPADAQARKIKVLGAKTDPQHPFAGYAVGADESADPVGDFLDEFAPSVGFSDEDDSPQLQLDQVGGESDRNDKFSYIYSFNIFSSDGEQIGWCEARMSTGKLSGDINDKDFAVSLRDISEPLVTQALSEIHKHQAENPDEIDEADFNPGRRGFLKKAGAVAATAAMPTGLAGAAAKAIAPAASWASTLSAPLAGLTAVDLDNIINLLMSSKPESMISGKDPYDLDIMKSIAQDAARESWGNPWMEGNAAKAFLDAVELGRKKGMDGEDIIQDLFIVTKKQYMQELKKLSPEEVAKVKSQSLNPDNKSEPAASTPSGMSGLARAAGAQIGRTMKNVGKATATTVLNQPAKSAALPAPSVSPGMQIPKQKSRAAASPFNDDHSELDQYVKEEFNRHPDDINEESGAVVAHGYAYNRQDQRVAWTREFASEAAATEWARRRNATVLSIVPKPVNEDNPASAWPDFGAAKTYESQLGEAKQRLAEGARVDRMVRHIASSEKATGKSAKDAESIAWATVNKRGMLDNKNKKKGVKETKMSTDIRAKNRAVVKKIQGKEVKEDITQEDIITKLKARLGDYLSDLGQQIKKDPALQDKLSAETPGDQVGPPVKTLTTDDGHQISIYGNEDDGFRISIKNRSTPSKFSSLDEAVMACEMYCAHRRKQALTADYVDEA